MAIGDVFRFSMLYSNPTSGCRAANVVNVKQFDNLIFDTPGEDLVQAFLAGPWLDISACISSVWVLEKLLVRGVTDETYGFDYEPVGETGAQAGQSIAPQLAQVISWKTGLIGDSFNGRTFFPSTVEDFTNAGNIAPAQLENLQAVAENFLQFGDGVTTTLWTLGVYSKKLDVFTPATNGVVRRSLKTMRHRASTTG